MSNEINAVIARRQAAYDRAVAKLEKAERAAKKYENANDGFLSHDLLEVLDKASNAVSKTYATLVKAQKLA